MTRIQSSTDSHNDISNFCNKTNSHVFTTKSTHEDSAVTSIQAYEQLVGKQELYSLLEAGEQDVIAGRTKPLKEVMNDLREKLSRK